VVILFYLSDALIF
jgi:hypothetical protein